MPTAPTRFISYARNFEDILLWRALRHVERGFYVDVGAGDPNTFSVTRAFYERGWHGLNIEPSRSRILALQKARPADVSLQVVAGSTDEAIGFYDIEGSFESTRSEARARVVAAGTAPVVLRQLNQRRLTELVEEHAHGPVHFMKIDVCGDEAAVLDGLDLARIRPWILVVAGVPADASRGAALAQAGYDIAYRDGHSAYYVAREQAALAQALATPPSEADGFRLCDNHPFTAPLTPLIERAERLQVDADAARKWAAEHVERYQKEMEKLKVQLEAAHAESHARLDHAERLRARVAELEGIIDALVKSMSWKVTRPLRGGKALVGRVRTRLRGAPARARQGARSLAVRLAKRAIGAIKNRPRLFFFIRHHIGRHPRLVELAKRMLARTQAAAAAQAAVPVQAEHLSAPARTVLADLRRSVERARSR